MNRTLAKTMKVGGWASGGLVSLLAVFIGLLAFPGFMFAHQLQYRNITAHSDQDLHGRIEPTLARVHAQIAASEIDAPALERAPVRRLNSYRL